MGEDTKKIASVQLGIKKPTTLSMKDLYSWVVWQIPRALDDGLCGAVRPPIAGHGWFPAIILLKTKSVRVYAHLEQEFSSPESAFDYFNKKSDNTGPPTRGQSPE